MDKITLEIFNDGIWEECGQVVFHGPNNGPEEPTTFEYDINYFVDRAAIDHSADMPVTDRRAASILYPVNLSAYAQGSWPPFLLDLMPQGHAKLKLARHMELEPDAPASQLQILKRSGANPIGNLRIKEAYDAERLRLANIAPVGITKEDILGRSDIFNEVIERFALLSSGSSAMQGEWPKVAMTLADDGLYYPDSLIGDTRAVEHFIVKLLKSSDIEDRQILASEAGYSRIAQALGLNVHKPSEYRNNVLIIPRFDRSVDGGHVVRFGQESIVSALGYAEYGRSLYHEQYIDLIKRVSSDPDQDIVEYVKRDIANRAFGNPDNHGRNTALSKLPDGSVRLSPLFDFAPMKLTAGGIVRAARWEVLHQQHMDSTPDWKLVAQTIYPDDADKALALLEEVQGFGMRIERLGDLREYGLPERTIEMVRAETAKVLESIETSNNYGVPRP